jgi:hypothetical protein
MSAGKRRSRPVLHIERRGGKFQKGRSHELRTDSDFLADFQRRFLDRKIRAPSPEGRPPLPFREFGKERFVRDFRIRLRHAGHFAEMNAGMVENQVPTLRIVHVQRRWETLSRHRWNRARFQRNVRRLYGNARGRGIFREHNYPTANAEGLGTPEDLPQSEMPSHRIRQGFD